MTTGRTFAYCRVSSTEQTTANQIEAIKAKGYVVTKNRVIEETISGSTHAMERPAFKTMIEHKLEPGDKLVVLKLDRLGRDNIDVQNTITLLMEKGITVISLDLPVSDLTSSEGKLMLQLFATFAEFERNRIRERTQEGLKRAKAQGKKLGRPKAIGTTNKVQDMKEEGRTQSQVAELLNISIRTVKRHWSKASITQMSK